MPSERAQVRAQLSRMYDDAYALIVYDKHSGAEWKAALTEVVRHGVDLFADLRRIERQRRSPGDQPVLPERESDLAADTDAIVSRVVKDRAKIRKALAELDRSDRRAFEDEMHRVCTGMEP